MTISQIVNKNVCLSNGGKNTVGASRLSTAYVSRAAFTAKMGAPHKVNDSEGGLDGAGKVHVIWYFNTPQGTATVYDYWWNDKQTLSIGAKSFEAAHWLAKLLRINPIQPCGNHLPL